MAAVVVDANITIALLVNLPYSTAADKLFSTWWRQKTPLYAPSLWPVEITSSLRKAVTVGQVSEEDAIQALDHLERLDVQVIAPDTSLLQSSLTWARKLNDLVAYDAQYLALAESLAAEFWTADNRLASAARSTGTTFAHYVAE